jgi:hypothetical protein
MHRREHEPDRVHTEDLALDIGEGFGALVLYTGPELVGREIEVSLKSQEQLRTHAAVHERRIQGKVIFAGVYPELPEGEYRIWSDAPRTVTEFTIVSGQVTEIDWRP